MLTKRQMEHMEFIFKMAKENLFADGFLVQVYMIIQKNKVTIFPVPSKVLLSASIGEELAKELTQIPDCDLVLFISEIWRVKREKEECSENLKEHIQPSLCDNRKEAIMMTVLEAKGDKETHVKLGYIKRDAEGGAYIDEEEWLPQGEFKPIRRAEFPTSFNA